MSCAHVKKTSKLTHLVRDAQTYTYLRAAYCCFALAHVRLLPLFPQLDPDLLPLHVFHLPCVATTHHFRPLLSLPPSLDCRFRIALLTPHSLAPPLVSFSGCAKLAICGANWGEGGKEGC
jgi:hypothetical protein